MKGLFFLSLVTFVIVLLIWPLVVIVVNCWSIKSESNLWLLEIQSFSLRMVRSMWKTARMWSCRLIRSCSISVWLVCRQLGMPKVLLWSQVVVWRFWIGIRAIQSFLSLACPCQWRCLVIEMIKRSNFGETLMSDLFYFWNLLFIVLWLLQSRCTFRQIL